MGRESKIPKTVYIPSIAKIYLCREVDPGFKSSLKDYFTSYKLSDIKSATHVIMKGESLSLDILRGILRGCIIYDINSK